MRCPIRRLTGFTFPAWFGVLLSLTTLTTLFAADYYVSPSGNDNHDGSLESPFRTIARASQVLQPGDTCIIRAGVYEEVLRPANSGTSGQPIIYRAYPGENAQLSAMQALSGWELDSDSVYRTTVDWDLEQRNFVMHEETALDLARWPNNSDGDVWTLNSLRNTGGSGEDVITGAFLDYAPGIPAHDWSQGGSVFFYGDRPGSGWTAWKAFITGSTGSRVTFALDKNPAWIRTAHPPTDGGEFFLEGIREALDYENEWFFDSATRTLYLQIPGGEKPADGAVAMRRRIEAIDLRDRSYVEIHDLRVLGGEILISGSNNRLFRVTSRYGNHSRGVVRGFHANSRSVHISGSDHIIEKCDIGFGAGTGIWDSGTNTVITNCYIHDFNTLGDYDAIVMVRDGGGGTRLTHNTITRGGRDAIQMVTTDNEVAYNDVSYSNLIADDCALFYTLGGPKRIEIHHNWFHDAYSHGSKTKAAGIYLDNDSNGFDVHHNVVWNTEWTGVQINWNGTDINIFNNTFWGNSQVMGAWHKEGTAFSNVKVYNNLADNGAWEPQSDKQNNLVLTSTEAFVAAEAGDFRLTTGASAIDAGREIDPFTAGFQGTAPDVGAYEHDGEFWIPGIDWDPTMGPVGFSDSRLVNLSVRTPLAESQNLIVGFVTAGGERELLVRAVGPGLAPYLSGFHTDTVLNLYQGQTWIAENDDWDGTLSDLMASVGAFALEAGSKDAAMQVPIRGPHSAHVTGPSSGTILLEAYDVGGDDDATISNVSARNEVGTGDRVLIAGFVINGDSPRSLLIRGVGPTLGAAPYNLPGTLVDPKIEVFNRSGIKVGENARWSSTLTPVFDRIGAFQLQPGSLDAALRITLEPGAYSVALSGNDGGTGEAIIEVYDLP
ncbi:MAG: carbohydrate-binding protein [Synoicihabitans sp.]